jgi:hypothetical protein
VSRAQKDVEVEVDVVVDRNIDADIDYHLFDLHQRFDHLKAPTIASRLQLASLFAATGSLLPEPRLSMTSGEYAMELVRQSWTNKPLSLAEQSKLQCVANFTQ